MLPSRPHLAATGHSRCPPPSKLIGHPGPLRHPGNTALAPTQATAGRSHGPMPRKPEEPLGSTGPKGNATHVPPTRAARAKQALPRPEDPEMEQPQPPLQPLKRPPKADTPEPGCPTSADTNPTSSATDTNLMSSGPTPPPAPRHAVKIDQAARAQQQQHGPSRRTENG